MNLPGLINELERMADQAMHVPVLGKLLMDEASLQQILEEMRQVIPDEGRSSQRLVAERDRILNEARTQARHILEDAQAQVNSRLEEQNTVQMARERARGITGEAEQQAAHIRSEANSYVAAQLNALESRLQRVMHEVQAGQRFLTQPVADRQGSAGAGTDEAPRGSAAGGAPVGEARRPAAGTR